jgi:hypothetical protein
MTFDDRHVFTAVNADKVKTGSKVIVSDNYAELKNTVVMDGTPTVITGINRSSFKDRFITKVGTYSLCYVVESIGDLKWTDIKIGDLVCLDSCTEMVVGIDINPEPDEEDGLLYHVCVGGGWISDEDLSEWKKVN